ncbi:DUF86 domain-containing protein [bacterium]|nr:DUF86 domain-containing protein [bacterium]
MLSEEKDKAYLWDMLDASMAIQDFIRGKTVKDYLTDRLLRGAVERYIEIIGEAARHISDELKEIHSEIPWRSIIGQRNILIHEYGEVRHEMVWNVAKYNIPDLITAIRAIMPAETEGG